MTRARAPRQVLLPLGLVALRSMLEERAQGRRACGVLVALAAWASTPPQPAREAFVRRAAVASFLHAALRHKYFAGDPPSRTGGAAAAARG